MREKEKELERRYVGISFFPNDECVAKNFTGNHENNAVRNEKNDNVTRLFRAVTKYFAICDFVSPFIIINFINFE